MTTHENPKRDFRGRKPKRRNLKTVQLLLSWTGMILGAVSVIKLVTEGRHWFAFFVAVSLIIVTALALFAIHTDRSVGQSGERLARIVLAGVLTGFAAFAIYAALTPPKEVAQVVWVFGLLWVLVVALECSITERAAHRHISKKDRESWFLITVSLLGTAVLGLALGGAGVAISEFRNGAIVSGIAGTAQAVVLAAMAYTLLVGGEVVIAIATFSVGIVIAGFGTAVALDGATIFGISLACVGFASGGFGISLWFRKPVWAGAALIVGAAAATIAARAAASTEVPSLVLPLLLIGVGATANGLLFIAIRPKNPFRALGSGIWSTRGHLIIASCGLLITVLSVGAAQMGSAIGHEGAALAFGSFALGGAAFSSAVLLSAWRKRAARRDICKR